MVNLRWFMDNWGITEITNGWLFHVVPHMVHSFCPIPMCFSTTRCGSWTRCSPRSHGLRSHPQVNYHKKSFTHIYIYTLYIHYIYIIHTLYIYIIHTLNFYIYIIHTLYINVIYIYMYIHYIYIYTLYIYIIYIHYIYTLYIYIIYIYIIYIHYIFYI